MKWATPSHLEVTYDGKADLGLQVVKYSGIDISVRDLSGKTTNALLRQNKYPVSTIGAWEGPERILNIYAGDRCVRQTWWHNRKPHVFTFKYMVTAQGQIRETVVKEPNGTLRRVVFDANGYQTRDTYMPAIGEPLSISFNRDSSTNNLKTISVTCSGKNASRRLTAPVGLARSGEAERNQLLSLCRDVSR